MIDDGKGNPILATWQYGLGRTVAFTDRFAAVPAVALENTSASLQVPTPRAPASAFGHTDTLREAPASSTPPVWLTENQAAVWAVDQVRDEAPEFVRTNA